MERLRELLSFRGEKGLANDERGILGLTLAEIAIAVGSLFGIGIASAVSFQALIGMLVVIVIAVGFIGAVLFDIPFKWAVYLSIACLAVVAFVSLGKFMGFGLAVLGIVVYFLPIKQRPMVFGAVIAFGIGAAILATVYAPEAAQMFGAEKYELQQMIESGVMP